MIRLITVWAGWKAPQVNSAYNSLLSEYAVLGFEYMVTDWPIPNALVLWKRNLEIGQWGANDDRPVYRRRWTKMESHEWRCYVITPRLWKARDLNIAARMERYLQMCAELNMVITNITTAANLFHALRRQMTWPFRKPLINFSPKANLRHPGSYSHISEFTQTGFKEVIDDSTVAGSGIGKKCCCARENYISDLCRKKNEERYCLWYVPLNNCTSFAS